MQPILVKWSTSLEYNKTNLYLKKEKYDIFNENALPLEISVIDSTISLLSRIFPKVNIKNQIETLQSFVDCTKNVKQNQYHIQENIFAAFLWSLKVFCNV